MRTITPAQFKALPECFQEKIKIDSDIDKLRSFPVIDFELARRGLSLQETQRLRCKALIKKNNNGGGTGNING